MNYPRDERSTALPAKRLLLIASVMVLTLSVASFANDTELALAKSRESALSAGHSQFFAVSLHAGDFVQINFDPHGKELIAITYDPSGNRFRGARLGPDPDRFDFFVERTGTYRIEVAARDKTVAGAFTITLEKVVGLTARLAFARPARESSRIKALKASVEGGKPESVAAFWEEIRKEGAPILEPLPGDDKNMLATFLWKGTPATQNVVVLRLPYAGAAPDNYLMHRLAETDVWYATVVVDRTARFDYTLAPNVPRFQGIAYGIDNDTTTMIATAARPDPLNPKRWSVDMQSVDAPEFQGSSIV